MGKATPPIF